MYVYEPNPETDELAFAQNLKTGQWFRPLTVKQYAAWQGGFAQLTSAFGGLNSSLRLRGIFADGEEAMIWVNDNDVIVVKRPGHEPLTRLTPPPADMISREEAERTLSQIKGYARERIYGLANQAARSIAENIDEKITEIKKGHQPNV